MTDNKAPPMDTTSQAGDYSTGSYSAKEDLAPDSPEHDSPNERSWKAWSQVLGSFLLGFNSWGLVNSYGVFQSTYSHTNPPLASPSSIAWIGSIQSFSLLFLGVFTGPVFDAGRARLLVISGTVLLVLGLVFTSISGPSPNAPVETYWQIVLAQGLCVGFGMGLGFMPSVAIPASYFQRHRSFAVGTALTGSSVGGIVYPVILRAILPHVGFRWAVRAVALVALVTAGTACIILKQRPSHDKSTLLALTALKQVKFVIVIAGIFCSFVGVYVPYFFIETKAISDNVQLNGLQSYWLVSFLNVGGVFGRLVLNFLADKINALTIHGTCVVIGGILIFAWPFAQSLGALVTFSLLYGFFSGGFTSLPPASVACLTPDKTQLGGKLGLTFSINSVAVLIGPPIAGVILQNGGYSGVSIFAGVFSTIGGILLCLARLLKD